jgi:hypothetical protein
VPLSLLLLHFVNALEKLMDASLSHAHIIEIGRHAVSAQLDVASVTFHCVRFTTTCLTICEYCSVITLRYAIGIYNLRQ